MGRERTTVWKVVSVQDGKYYSWCVDVPKLICEYKLGETTYPPLRGTRLFAFGNKMYAGLYNTLNCAVLECSAIITGTPTLISCDNRSVIDPSLYNLDLPKFRLWWQWQIKGGDMPKFMNDPIFCMWHCSSNSVLCSEITPISVVDTITPEEEQKP